MLVGAVAALVAVGAGRLQCQPSTSAGTVRRAKARPAATLDVLSPSPTINLDPAKSQNLATTTLGLVLRRLTTWQISPEAAAKVVPDLATDTGSSERRRQDLDVHPQGRRSSSPTARRSRRPDIKYGVERSFAAQLSGGLGYHKTLLVGGDRLQGPVHRQASSTRSQTPDAKTIVFHLNKRLRRLAVDRRPCPRSRRCRRPRTNPTTYGNDPIASGPYQVSSRTSRARQLVLERNPNWAAATDPVRTAGPDSVVFKMSQDPTGPRSG